CNATQAAIRAGYSVKTAKKASEWINAASQGKPGSKFNAEMRAYIDEQLEQLHNSKIADAREVLEYLTSVLRGKSESNVVVVEGTGDGCSEARLLSKSPDEKERLKAAELIGKRYGMFKDNVDVSGAVPVVISGGDELED
ncbi:MAG: terminase small subunit, partial [Ruminiclostridium sp.]|nr:terminase small subunit [Ruminiclostridium sp.]